VILAQNILVGAGGSINPASLSLSPTVSIHDLGNPLQRHALNGIAVTLPNLLLAPSLPCSPHRILVLVFCPVLSASLANHPVLAIGTPEKLPAAATFLAALYWPRTMLGVAQVIGMDVAAYGPADCDYLQSQMVAMAMYILTGAPKSPAVIDNCTSNHKYYNGAVRANVRPPAVAGTLARMSHLWPSGRCGSYWYYSCS
jgi:hypothetical protein